VVFFFITLVLATIFLLPTLAKISDLSRYPAADMSHRQKRGLTKRWWLEYYLLYGPFLYFVLFVFFQISLFDNGRLGQISWMCLIPLVLLYVACWHKAHGPKLRDMILNSLSSAFSFSMACLITLFVIERASPQMNLLAAAVVCVVISLAVHFLAVIVINDWKDAVALYFVILAALCIIGPGPGFLGGLALQYLGIGGGIPVSIQVKTYSAGGGSSGVAEIPGCLILMSGNDVLIRPTNQIGGCNLQLQSVLRQSLSLAKTYSRVNRYVRADVVRVSKFPDGCATVDGLPSC
jgi:hypothetical protein